MDEHSVRHVAKLARLELSDDEVKRMAIELSKITGYIEQLQAVNVAHVQATVHPFHDANVWREDQIKPSLPRDVAVANAPDKEEGFFKVPPVIE